MIENPNFTGFSELQLTWNLHQGSCEFIVNKCPNRVVEPKICLGTQILLGLLKLQLE